MKLEGELLRGTGGALASATLTVQHIYFQKVSFVLWLSHVSLTLNANYVDSYIMQVPETGNVWVQKDSGGKSGDAPSKQTLVLLKLIKTPHNPA